MRFVVDAAKRFGMRKILLKVMAEPVIKKEIFLGKNIILKSQKV